MIGHCDLVALWGEDGVVRVDPAVLRRLSLPVEASDFLANVGLPRRFPRFFTAVVDLRDASVKRDTEVAGGEGDTLIAPVTSENDGADSS
jgi:hypothetical protein